MEFKPEYIIAAIVGMAGVIAGIIKIGGAIMQKIIDAYCQQMKSQSESYERQMVEHGEERKNYLATMKETTCVMQSLLDEAKRHDDLSAKAHQAQFEAQKELTNVLKDVAENLHLLCSNNGTGKREQREYATKS